MAHNMDPWEDSLELAESKGREYAEAQIEAGVLEPRDEPLSGEWADEPTVQSIVVELGYTLSNLDDWQTETLADSWELGYESANWPNFVGYAV